MAHVRRGRMVLNRENLGNVANPSGKLNAVKTNNGVGGAVTKKVVPTRATLKTTDLNPKATGLTVKTSRISLFSKKQEPKTSKKCLDTIEPMMVDQQPSDLQKVLSPLDILPEGVSDVDEIDSKDPQLCSENVRAIYIYLRHLEKAQPVKENFLQSAHVNAKMRAVLVNWLAEVHEQFKLLQETLYLTVAILDRYLSQGILVKRQKLQLVGVTAMFIASKYEEMYNPEIEDFVYIADNSFKSDDIRTMEIEILKALNFNLGRPLSLHFLRRNSKAGDVSADHHNLAKLAIEASFTDYSVAHIDPSRMAASALLLALRVIEDETEFDSVWTRNLSYYSGYDVLSLQPTSKKLAANLLSMGTSKFKTIYNKYTHNSRLGVSKLIGTTYRERLEMIANE